MSQALCYLVTTLSVVNIHTRVGLSSLHSTALGLTSEQAQELRDIIRLSTVIFLCSILSPYIKIMYMYVQFYYFCMWEFRFPALRKVRILKVFENQMLTTFGPKRVEAFDAWKGCMRCTQHIVLSGQKFRCYVYQRRRKQEIHAIFWFDNLT